MIGGGLPPTQCVYPDNPVWVEDNNIDDVLLLLGLVDGHTHPVFAGDRVHEFAMKVRMFLYNGR